jgi:hypothetical protein
VGFRFRRCFGHGVGATWRAAALQPWRRGEAGNARRMAGAVAQGKLGVVLLIRFGCLVFAAAVKVEGS